MVHGGRRALVHDPIRLIGVLQVNAIGILGTGCYLPPIPQHLLIDRPYRLPHLDQPPSQVPTYEPTRSGDDDHSAAITAFNSTSYSGFSTDHRFASAHSSDFTCCARNISRSFASSPRI